MSFARILLAFTIFFGGLTVSPAATPQVEKDFVKMAPQVMDLFKLMGNQEAVATVEEELKYLKESPGDTKSEAKIRFFELFLKFPGRSGTLANKRQLLEAYGDWILPPELAEYRLTKLEAAAISSYTSDDYKVINPELRKSNPSKAVIAYATMINAALEKLPEFVGVVKRGVKLPGSVLQTFYVGNVIEFKSFTSTTSFMELSSFEYGHRLIIHSKHGRDVEKLSNRNEESEVLFKAGTKFRVIAARTNVTLGGNIAELEYELEEIE